MLWKDAPADLIKMRFLTPPPNPDFPVGTLPLKPWELVIHDPSLPWGDDDGALTDGLLCCDVDATNGTDDGGMIIDRFPNDSLWGLGLSDRYVSACFSGTFDEAGVPDVHLAVWQRSNGLYVGSLKWPEHLSIESAVWEPASQFAYPVCRLAGHEELVAKLVSLGL